ncbi:MAG: AmmeMemoRadiSam system protein B [Candidatus Schekmanbacteria bacterium]|nr:AmmeMemoRadiSam system protein B [Candidatus Schekmanbacteria bacterium]
MDRRRRRLPGVRRDMQFVATVYEGKQVVVAQDPIGLGTEPIVLTPEGAALLGLVDRCQTMGDLQDQVTLLFGARSPAIDELEALVTELDRQLLLDSDRYREARRSFVESFEVAPLRQASCAGSAYPATPGELEARLAGIVASNGNEAAEACPLAVVAPHIDIRVGEAGYAAAYGALRGARPELVVILGVGHAMGSESFCATEKDFETPLGMVRTDTARVRRLRDAGAIAFARSDFPHRREHSIEFQLVFLQHVLANPRFCIVPVLCGSFHRELTKVTRASEISGVREVLREIRSWVTAAPGEVLLIAGVDLSHVGPKFGHEKDAQALVRESEAHDRALLEALLSGRVEAFWGEAKRVEDYYNVCGFSALACLAEILPPVRGRLLHYGVWHEPPTRSAVSFAAARFDALED